MKNAFAHRLKFALAALVLMNVALGAAAQSLVLSDKDQALLRQQALQAQDAVNAFDAPRMIALTHPAIFKLAGGEDNFRRIAAQSVENMKQQGIQFTEVQIEVPTVAYAVGKERICFVKRMSVLKVEARRFKSKGYWVAISDIQKNEWKFIDGAGVDKNNEALWVMFPNLPRDVRLPEFKQEAIP